MDSMLKKARLDSGLTGFDLGGLCGMNEGRYFAIERGRFRPRADEADALSQVLGVPLGDLFPAGVQAKGGGHE